LLEDATMDVPQDAAAVPGGMEGGSVHSEAMVAERKAKVVGSFLGLKQLGQFAGPAQFAGLVQAPWRSRGQARRRESEQRQPARTTRTVQR
jgi:hypothetical protein